MNIPRGIFAGGEELAIVFLLTLAKRFFSAF